MNNDLFYNTGYKMTDKETICSLNTITNNQNKIIDDLQGKILLIKKEKENLQSSMLELQKKIFDLEVENKVLAERIIELEKMTPNASSINLETELQDKKNKIIQDRLQQRRVLYGSLRSARTNIMKNVIEQQV